MDNPIPARDVRSYPEQVNAAITSVDEALGVLDGRLSSVTGSLTRAWNKIGALWLFAAGGYVTGLTGIILAVIQ